MTTGRLMGRSHENLSKCFFFVIRLDPPKSNDDTEAIDEIYSNSAKKLHLLKNSFKTAKHGKYLCFICRNMPKYSPPRSKD